MMNPDNKLQPLALNLLKVFIDICEKNHLRYYVIGGSLIGVLRHKGFIPWDDDIDIGMPREDFDKFVSIENYPEGYGYISHKNTPEWKFAFGQFIDKESEIEILLNEKPRKANVWLDIFPIDGIPGGALKSKQVKKILHLRYLIQIPNLKTQVAKRANRPMKEKIVLKLLHWLPVGMFLDSKKLLTKLENILHEYKFDECEYAGNLLGRYREREVVPQRYFGEPLKLPFEDMEVCVPAMYHELQTALYGNYMQIPPADKRETHYVKIIKLRKLN